MGWLAVVPLKARAGRKTRLAGHLTPQQRYELSQTLFAHVVLTLSAAPSIDAVAALSNLRPEGYTGRLIGDQGRGLNAELTALACDIGDMPLLIMHADLPLVGPDDVAALLEASAGGCAIAPDRHGAGTNALALTTAAQFSFAFGPDSLAQHVAQAKGRARLVTRPGLALDIDTADDLAIAAAAGFVV